MAEQVLLYVRDVARLLGRTEAGIRKALERGSESVPPPVKVGERIAWRRADFDRWVNRL